MCDGDVGHVDGGIVVYLNKLVSSSNGHAPVSYYLITKGHKYLPVESSSAGKYNHLYNTIKMRD